MKSSNLFALLALAVIPLATQAQSNWQDRVERMLPLLGHRNWIAVVDSAYPLQSSNGITTIDSGTDEFAVLDFVLNTLRHSKHVRPIIHTDEELDFLTDDEAPGVTQYRNHLKQALTGAPTDEVLHQVLIDRLHEVGNNFQVLVIKTNSILPYTSVFLQLDCSYWSDASEAKLRRAITAKGHKSTDKP